MNNKEKLFAALDELYSIMCEPVRPIDKKAWKEWVWEYNKDRSTEEFENLIETTLGIAHAQHDEN